MEDVFLIRPTLFYDQQIQECRREFLDLGERMYGSSSLAEFDETASWLRKLQEEGSPETCSGSRVPSSQFLCVRRSDHHVVGLINLRHGLNERLLLYAGHIGYCIRPSERRKGYGKKQLLLSLEEAKNLGLSQVLITCDRENSASRNTIRSVGAIFENEVFDEESGEHIERYWIDLMRENNENKRNY